MYLIDFFLHKFPTCYSQGQLIVYFYTYTWLIIYTFPSMPLSNKVYSGLYRRLYNIVSDSWTSWKCTFNHFGVEKRKINFV